MKAYKPVHALMKHPLNIESIVANYNENHEKSVGRTN